MKTVQQIVAASLAALMAGAAADAEAAEAAALRKGRIVPDVDGVVTPRAWLPGLARRGWVPRPPCDESWPRNPRSAIEFARDGRPVPMSSYEDDPFAADSIVECLGRSQFRRDEAGALTLDNARLAIEDAPWIFREDATGEFTAFANNPWPRPASNGEDNFLFPHEPRFPRHEIERDAAGAPVLRDGLQVWKPRELFRGMNTLFEAALAARRAAEAWSGRPLRWGNDDRMLVNSHAFIDFNAFFSPAARELFFGVVPYRLPGETGIENIKMFEIASSWEVAAHEAGHALHVELKPNRHVSDPGYQTWSESFADQLTMWTTLRDPSRVESLVAATPDFSRSNALSAFVEGFAALVGEGTGLRDAVNDLKVSTTRPDVHDRSEVLTGAAYTLFLEVLRREDRRGGTPRALMAAGDVMGTFVVRAADYMPENRMTLEDVAKGMLKVDKEVYGGRFRPLLVDEFLRREIFDVQSLPQWLAHEAAVPRLRLRGTSHREIDALVQANLATLGIGPGFGLALQGVTREQRFGQTLVRVQLTVGRGPNAVALANHGLLVFRENATLADWHGPFPADPAPGAVQARARALVEWARQSGLDRHGAPLAVIRKPDGELTVETHVMRGSAMKPYAEVFSLEKPSGERREVVTPLLPR